MKVQQIQQILLAVGFSPTPAQGQVWIKSYPKHRCRISVDFSNERIRYPSTIKKHDETTSNFAHAENFVVLECVDRLLTLGYKPNSIELEKRWNLGHNSGGKLDILVKHGNGGPYLMVECKTYGDEYEKAIDKMLDKRRNGGQLFSYWQQDRKAELLCLYTSILEEDGMRYESKIIKIEEIFRETGGVDEAYRCWNKQFHDKGIFEAGVSPYMKEFKPLTRGDLKELKREDGERIFHQFLEILRHNIVSDKGNAFNKIFNLFLCKIIDEDLPECETVNFQWFEGGDDFESLLGRLNALYKRGMSRYLNKVVTDYSVDDFPDSMKNDKAIKMINELRLYKNQEFAFVDVFNQASFMENAKIVKEVVELLQGWQIRYTHKQQFLGEFFELLLNAGFKQETGQFFTPVPLVRFMLKSLPIKSIIQEKVQCGESNFMPYVIDYACGSGHFLTEAMDIFQEELEALDEALLQPTQKSKIRGYLADQFGWANEYVYGIERDYRLAKTSKLASFLNGDGEAKIVHASGIDPFNCEAYEGKLRVSKRSKGEFDILVANPPYTISGFKATVVDGQDSFELFSNLTDKSKEIEALFVERMTQLVKPGGVAGIILPRSILNNAGVHGKARTMVIEHFQIKAIVLLHGNAFHAAGINTAVLFLRKRQQKLNLETKDDYMKTLEGDGDIVLANSGTNDFERDFLGYKFSSRLGKEGIQTSQHNCLLDKDDESSSDHLNSYVRGMFLDENVSDVSDRLSKYVKVLPIRNLLNWDADKFSDAFAFLDKYEIFAEDESKIASMSEAISVLESGKRPKGGVDEISEGAFSLGGEHIDGNSGEVSVKKPKYVSMDYYENMASGKLEYGDILLNKDGAKTGKCALFNLVDGKYCVNEHVFRIRSKADVCDQRFLFYFMMSSFFRKQAEMWADNKMAIPGLNKQELKRTKMYLPSLEDQEEIVKQLDAEWGNISAGGGGYGRWRIQGARLVGLPALGTCTREEAGRLVIL